MVRLYDTTSWKLVGEPISGHTLTITRIAFSPDDRMILSVSRDRSWVLSEVQAGGGAPFISRIVKFWLRFISLRPCCLQ